MKKCPWCGQQYPDEVSVCAIDQEPLESSSDAAPVPPSEAGELEDEPAAPSPIINLDDSDIDEPEGFRFLGRFDPFEAAGLLKRFTDDKIRFQIDRIEKVVTTPKGSQKRDLIAIFVHQDDEDNATKILSVDWKV